MGYRFSSDVITLHVKEDVAVGSVVGQVNATDDDSGDNARISYSCDSKTFNIDTDTGMFLKFIISKPKKKYLGFFI